MAQTPQKMPTAINPQTGERIGWNGQAWIPLGSKAPSQPEMTASLDAIATARGDRDRYRNVVDRLRRFDEINRRTSTGPILADINLPIVGNVGNPIRGAVAAINPKMASDYQQMEAIASELAPAMRIPGSGASSDRDVAMFKAALPGVDKFGSANQAISEDFAQRLAVAQKRLDELEGQFSDRRTVIGQTPPPSRPQQGLPRLTPQQAAQLPPGTRFVGTDGVERIRR